MPPAAAPPTEPLGDLPGHVRQAGLEGLRSTVRLDLRACRTHELIE
jgi:hypothetical protein